MTRTHRRQGQRQVLLPLRPSVPTVFGWVPGPRPQGPSPLGGSLKALLTVNRRWNTERHYAGRVEVGGEGSAVGERTREVGGSVGTRFKLVS